MNAEVTSWKRKPFTEGVSIPFHLEIQKGQIDHINKGLIPQEMEDKWFIYYEEPYLFLRRSWTGQPVYRLKFVESDTGYYVSEALFSSDLAEKEKDDLEYQGKLAYFLVCNFLLGQKVPVPKPSGIEEPFPGVFQHHISGTGYPEETTKSKKKWWQNGYKNAPQKK